MDQPFHKTPARKLFAQASGNAFLQLAAFALLGPAVWLSVAASTGRAAAPEIPYSEQVLRADDYFLGRRNLQNVRKAIQLLRQRVAEDPQDYEAWWRLSKFNCYMARHAAGSERSKFVEAAVGAGKKAVALRPNRPEGHFWLGADLGLMAEDRGFLRGLMMVDSVRKEMESVIRLDPNYEEAAGLRTLGRLDDRAPFFKGGDKLRSIQLLEEALKRFPHNSLTMLYLADSYLSLGRRVEARQQLENILKLCPDPQHGPEQEENQAQARRRLAKFFGANY